MSSLLSLLRRIALLKVGWGTVVWLILLAIFHPLFLPLLGYYVNEPGWKVAQIAAEKKDVYVCDRLVSSYYNIFISTSELQRDCIREYASLTQDPLACRLLPGPEKLDCLGGALADVPRACALNGNGTVGGNGINVPASECATGPASVRENPCCRIALISRVRTENDCSPLAGAANLHDECLDALAFKNHDPGSCESIQNPLRRTACTIRATALRRDPSICQGCLTPVDSIEELLELTP